MPGLEEVDVELSAGTPHGTGLLGVYLYHPNEDGRVEAETRGHAAGAQYTTYPVGPAPVLLDQAYVLIRDTNLYVHLGSMYVIAPLTVKRDEIAHLKTAVVYFATQAFGNITPDEKVWLAAMMPLVFSDEESI